MYDHKNLHEYQGYYITRKISTWREGRKKSSVKIHTLAPVCAAQPSLTLFYFTHPYILGIKRKGKADYIFKLQCCYLSPIYNKMFKSSIQLAHSITLLKAEFFLIKIKKSSYILFQRYQKHCAFLKRNYIWHAGFVGNWGILARNTLSRLWSCTMVLHPEIWIQSFPSPVLVVSPTLKNSICPSILSRSEKRRKIHAILKGICAK